MAIGLRFKDSAAFFPLADPDTVHRVDSAIIAGSLASPDAFEGVTSFLGRRDPQLPGKVWTDVPDIDWGWRSAS
ncbi:hypothetical protein SAMN05444580_12017 [Rhodococcus tukisamuensis]|uniref:Uncharacterized protein n=1 Tax=Rhodococcus tukisamuensis TaxID=168276 RepID=A0A1G7DN76_9NOCA|nr:hypothetical protein SAMN05444580_12017 [Rhodococcus tukisamuensis]